MLEVYKHTFAKIAQHVLALKEERGHIFKNNSGQTMYSINKQSEN
ncbi:MAG: hypothetical protein ACI9VM_000489 [Candidatus Azotimanducaceae bacterium]|jgi:hypothetical protein